MKPSSNRSARSASSPRRPPYRTAWPVLAAAVCLLPALAFAVPGDENWSDAYDQPGLTGRVFALGVYNDEIIAGGYQQLSADGQYFDHIARWNGSTWQPLGAGVGGPVRDFAIYQGDLIVAGEFEYAGGAPAGGVARWDGTQWHPLGAGLDLTWGTPEIFALAVYNDELYAGGLFDRAGGQVISTIARWDGVSWRSVGGGLSGSYYPRVWDLIVHDGKLYAGGTFETAAGQPVNRIATWDGIAWSDVGGGMAGTVTTGVFGLESFLGDVYACGNFHVAGSVPTEKIARWDGSQWHAVGSGIPDWSIGVSVYALKSFGTSLYVGGNFTSAGGVSSRALARWDGSQWQSVGGVNGTDLATTVFALESLGGQLYIGGEFSYGGFGPGLGDYVVSQSVIAFDGASWSQAGKGLGFNSDVESAVLYNGGIAAVGSFYEAGRSVATRVSFFNGTDWDFIGDFNHNVHAALVFEGDLVVSGDFTQVDGMPISGIARWNGTSWSGFGSGAGGGALAIYQGELYAGGLGGVRKWNGSSWETPGGTVIYGSVYDMHVYDGKLIVGGSHYSWNNILAWDGSSWSTVGGGTDGFVQTLTTWQGDLIAGGTFNQAGGAPARNIARWDGTSWTEFGGGLGNAVYSLGVLGDALYVGGGFNYLVGDPIDYIGFWDGANWQPMGSGLRGAPRVLLPDPALGVLYVGGGFFKVGGKPSFYFARWSPSGTAATTVPGVEPPFLTTVLLGNPAPNPARSGTACHFTLPQAAHVRAVVYDIRGRVVAELMNGGAAAGPHIVEWNGRDPEGREAPAGAYFLRLETGERSESRKIVIAR